MIEYWDYFLTGYDAPTGGMGMATVLHTEPERDIGAELREAYKEVTGQELAAPEHSRIGFV